MRSLIRAASLICAALGMWSPDCAIASSNVTSLGILANGAGGQTITATGHIQLNQNIGSDAALAAVWEHEITHVKDARVPGADAGSRAWCLQSEFNAYTAQIKMYDWVIDTFGPVASTDNWSSYMNHELHNDFWFVDDNMRLVKYAQCNTAYGFTR